ncbi:alpha/beta hydrolase [Microbacterium abyssi]|uniref:alpha/beta hydrolase n=1 Tax=Microbacterium abyssi TaxID=2782166 RepID=UPI0018886F34|nr:alpha/beta fold hydrolase [Microbacterium sp. A18JL241]
MSTSMNLAATHHAARRELVQVRGRAAQGYRTVRTYQWGTGTRAALLMHGWHGRASQFATLVRDLVAEGFRVHAFDAPAHGDSRGARTDARDWIAAARLIARDEGPFDLVVGHSFGAFAALAAVRDGVDAGRVVSIAGAGDVNAFHTQFARTMGLSAPALAAFGAAFYRRLGMTRADADAVFDSLAHPLPAATELLVIHDERDRALDVANARALHAAHGGRSRLLLTRGFGHNRLLVADEVLDAVLAFAADGAQPAGIRSSDATGLRH